MANKLGKILNKATMDVPASPRPISAEDKLRERRWRAEDAMRTLIRAEEIRRDKQLMADVRELAKKQAQDLKEIV